MKSKIIFFISFAGISIIFRFFCGVYVHDEFGDKELFIKHRPIWKFYSPIGMSDIKFEDLSAEEKIEQKYFNEFVRERGLSR
ncbi:hypothetical protein ASU31_05380 [Pedobacter ginsenosidimutans]|uniref:Uncharacterized protein n=1 Tax=Pedobacter ginsenosidimutans TaxID=687842 RepID=A0A0T5VTF1_9SPHI|nr:hypothetical protein [Pedobacter ginsenosidimutans]KRT17106.1 hypothetical protein ASU31_05380 [Pedobacter ginsenosidimutans]